MNYGSDKRRPKLWTGVFYVAPLFVFGLMVMPSMLSFFAITTGLIIFPIILLLKCCFAFAKEDVGCAAVVRFIKQSGALLGVSTGNIVFDEWEEEQKAKLKNSRSEFFSFLKTKKRQDDENVFAAFKKKTKLFAR